MAEIIGQLASPGCGNNCAATTSIEALNRACYCLSLDEAALRGGLEADLGTRGLSKAMVESHPHLFASVPMFISRGSAVHHHRYPGVRQHFLRHAAHDQLGKASASV